MQIINKISLLLLGLCGPQNSVSIYNIESFIKSIIKCSNVKENLDYSR